MWEAPVLCWIKFNVDGALVGNLGDTRIGGVAEKMNGIKLLSVAKAPALFNWAHRFCCDATVKDVMPDTENLAEFGKMITAKVMDVAPPKWLTE
ncbi:hypothetical protein POUND7_015492 [Theobroma cacao]